jgi:hypothetical protein
MCFIAKGKSVPCSSVLVDGWIWVDLDLDLDLDPSVIAESSHLCFLSHNLTFTSCHCWLGYLLEVNESFQSER